MQKEVEGKQSKEKTIHILFTATPDESTKIRSEEEKLSNEWNRDAYDKEFQQIWKIIGYNAIIHHISPKSFKEYIKEKIGKPENADMIFQLCDGSDIDGYLSGYTVGTFLKENNYTYIGANPKFVANCTNKHLMKDLFAKNGVSTSPYLKIYKNQYDTIEKDIETNKLKYPLFVKPATSYGGNGISKKSICWNISEVLSQIKELNKIYNDIILEEYVTGKEFTVLVYESEGEIKAFSPAQRIFPTDNKYEAYLTFQCIWIDDWTKSYKYGKYDDKVACQKNHRVSNQSF